MARLKRRDNSTSQDEGRLTKEQKTGFVLLLVFAFLAVGLGVLQLRNTIYNPFVVHVPKQDTDLTSLLDETTRLQQIDTDQDGLNDYDELQWYGTSPYLPDTDSDGVGDNEEIQAGENPLCPVGDVCDIDEDAVLTDDSEDVRPSPLLGEGGATASDILSFAEENTIPQQDNGLLDLNAIANDPDAIRALLLETNSLTAEQLEGVDDNTLLQIAKEILGSESTR
jgi:hypothetical protein